MTLATWACGEDSSSSSSEGLRDPGDGLSDGAPLDQIPLAGTDVPQQVPLAGSDIPQFVEPLPGLDIAGGSIATLTGNQPLAIRMCEFWADVLPRGTLARGEQPRTRVWGYVEGNACPANRTDSPALDTYTGPVIISQRSRPATAPQPPTTVAWVNELGTTDTTQVLAYKQSVDQTLHWAAPATDNPHCNAHGTPAPDSACARNYAGPIPAVVHLHGGEVPPFIDGGPDAWFLSQAAKGYKTHGPSYYSMVDGPDNQAVYAYPNTQEAAPLWFHDHTLGATSLNVYAGLAGGYLIVDPELTLPPGLTATGLSGANAETETTLIPLVIQDRAFDSNGQLFYPADSHGGMQSSPNPQHPYWVPEFFGDTNLVNGKVWPYLDVEPRRYRFLLINGALARAYELSFATDEGGAAGPSLWVIGTEEGYLDAPVEIDAARGQKLLMMPGERYDVIVDFSDVEPGTRLLLENTANAPYPDGDAPTAETIARVLQVRVGPCDSGACGADDPGYDPARGTPLLSAGDSVVHYTDPATGTLLPDASIQNTRQLTLNEVIAPASTATNPATGMQDTSFPGGPLGLLLNNTTWDGEAPRPYRDFTPISFGGKTLGYSELMREGDAEVWEIVNMTADAHPIHTHLVDMQIINRQSFDADGYATGYAATFPAAEWRGRSYAGGEYVPGFGPPLDYATGNPRALGGNPDITPFLTGALQPPAPEEAGWKDTITAPPSQVTRVVVRFGPSDAPLDAPAEARVYPFDPSGNAGYVWHCHITPHEDNEMMRPFALTPNPAVPVDQRPLQQGRDY